MAILASLNGKKRIGVAVLALIVVLFGVRSIVRGRTSDRTMLAGDQPIFEVQQGPLLISVSVSGTIKASEQEIIKCEVEGQTTILSIVPEGERVKEGDLLIELDASGLVDTRVDQEIRVQNAEAAFIGAREQLAVVTNQAESDVDKAKLTLQFAEEDLNNFENGEFPCNSRRPRHASRWPREPTPGPRNALTVPSGWAERDFITKAELDADRQDAVKAELDLELAEDERKLLMDFTHKRNLAQLESDVHQARMALERTERKASADVVQAEADLKAKESEYLRQKDKLEKIEEQIVKTKIYAPAAGLVVYATSAQGSWRGNAEPLDEGQAVRERQELIHLPTGSSFMAEVDVHEATLTKISPGQPVNLRVDALPGSAFRGRVTTVAPLPDAQSMWLNPDLKVYSTRIDIEGSTEGLRTGMTCLAEILVDEYPDALYVPVQAVVRVGGRPTVYLADGKTPEPREVELGLDNNRMVHILSGLKSGDLVMLTPPLAADKGDDSANGNGFATSIPDEDGEGATAPAQDGESRSEPPGDDGPRTRPRSSEEPSDAGGEEARVERGGDMSPEEREQRRAEREERMRNMSPEERERMIQGGGGRRRSRESAGPGEGTS